MYDYRTACRNRAYGFGALAGVIGVIGDVHWLAWRWFGARHYSTIINAWMIYRHFFREIWNMSHLAAFFSHFNFSFDVPDDWSHYFSSAACLAATAHDGFET